MLALYHKLFMMKGAKILPAVLNKEPTVSMHFNNKFIRHPYALKIKKILSVPSYYQDIVFSTETHSVKNVLEVETRSVKGLFNYLAKGVDVPPQDAKILNNTPIDVSPFVGDLFHVYYSNKEPLATYCKSIRSSSLVLYKRL